MEPLVAVTVTEYELAGVKAVVDKVKVDVPEVPGVKGRFAELNDTERPEALGVTEELMATVPVKPILATVTVDVAEFQPRNSQDWACWRLWQDLESLLLKAVKCGL